MNYYNEIANEYTINYCTNDKIITKKYALEQYVRYQ